MASCKDCVHCDVCDMPIITDGRKNASNCKKFKNKADYREVKHGYWNQTVEFGQVGKYHHWNCSLCGAASQDGGRENYCHNCGADMRGTTDDKQ